MTELVDPLAMASPPRPGITVIPDPAPAPAPADPLAGLHFRLIDAGTAELCGGTTPYSPCGRVMVGGNRVFMLPSGVWRCGPCASAAVDPEGHAARLAYQAQTGRSDMPPGWQPGGLTLEETSMSQPGDGDPPVQTPANTPAATSTPPESYTVSATTSTTGATSTPPETVTVENPP